MDMKDKIIDKAFHDVYYFNHFEELNVALNSRSPFMRDHEESVLQGFYLILEEIKGDESLQRHTLIQTMNNVRKESAVINSHNYPDSLTNAITLAIAHVRDVNSTKRMVEKYGETW